VWRDDDRSGALVFDDTVIITSYLDPDLLEDEAILDELHGFLHRLGREARQGEVAFVIDGDRLFSITEFDPS